MAYTLQFDCWTVQQAQLLQQALIKIEITSNLKYDRDRSETRPDVHLWLHLDRLEQLAAPKEIATQYAIKTAIGSYQRRQSVYMTLRSEFDVIEEGWLQAVPDTQFLRVSIGTRDGEHEYLDTCVAVCPAGMQPEDVAHGIAYSWKDDRDHYPYDRDHYWFEGCSIAVSVESIEVIPESDYEVLKHYLSELTPTDIEIQRAIAYRKGEPTLPELSDLGFEQELEQDILTVRRTSCSSANLKEVAIALDLLNEDEMLDVQSALSKLRQRVENGHAQNDAEKVLLNAVERIAAFPEITQVDLR
ncbi:MULTISPECIES: hypothetical protein [Leptolyngbya]|uniref:hypothetical protein n=1 Tax=Leptolyngbya TaxID=47251 RepID=UPI001689BED0|nr:hypothetical protein [Leptolyngbya sp. FACHB-1624]MBD1854806.1 hypothetical protein [Leptolyngbya sp. FACHB-1624]